MSFSGCVNIVENKSPTASITASSNSGVASFTIFLIGSGEDSDGEISSYSWDFGDGTTGTGSTTYHTFENAGTYSVKLTVTDDKDATGSDEVTVVASSSEGQLQPFFVTPLKNDFLYDDVFLWIGDNSGLTVQSSEFYYSTDLVEWTLINTDTDGSERTVSGKDVPLSDDGDGWSCYWNTHDLTEGWYYLRGEMLTADEETGQVDLMVYVEPTPPIPVINTPSYDDTLSGTVELGVTCLDEDTTKLILELLGTNTYYEKGVEHKQQAHYCHDVDGKNLSDTCCGPTSTASCLKYWAEYGYPTIMEDPATGDSINQSTLVEKLAKLMKTTESGTEDSDFVKGLRDYLEQVGVGCTNPNGLIVRVEENGYGNPPMDEHTGNNLTYERYRKELTENSEDVLWGVVWDWNDTTNKWEKGHWVVGNSVNSTLLNDTDGDGLKEHEVDLMDPAENQIIKVKMNTDGTYKDPTTGGWMYPEIMVTVSEKNPAAETWINLGDPYATDDGWGLSLDTTSYTNGYYYIRATIEDANGFTGQDSIVVNIQNEEVVNQDPIIEDIMYTQLHEDLDDLPHRYSLTVYASDPDENTPLTYEWSTDCGYFYGDTSSSTVEWRYDTLWECSGVTITVTVTDALGASGSFSKKLFET